MGVGDACGVCVCVYGETRTLLCLLFIHVLCHHSLRPFSSSSPPRARHYPEGPPDVKIPTTVPSEGILCLFHP